MLPKALSMFFPTAPYKLVMRAAPDAVLGVPFPLSPGGTLGASGRRNFGVILFIAVPPMSRAPLGS